MLPDPFVLPAGVVVEDTDPQVKYNGGWAALVSQGGYHGDRLALTNNSDASLSLTFTGTHVYYFSDRNADHGRYSIVLDDGAPVEQTSFSATLQVVQVLFEQELTPGEHIITLKNLEAKTMALDFFMYVPVGATTTTTSTSESSSSSSSTFSTASISSPTIIASPNPATESRSPAAATISSPGSAEVSSGVTPSPPRSEHNGLPPGAIAGIVLAVLAVVVFGGLAIFILRSRRRQQQNAAFAPSPLPLPVAQHHQPQMQQYHNPNPNARPPSYQVSSPSRDDQLLLS